MDDLVAILGPTASGKSQLALALAEQLNGEIVSCDSAQVFTGLDIGTAKPTPEDQARVPHHLLDRVEPSLQWTAATFQKEADRSIREIRSRGRIPFLCGGTGLWYRALIHGIFAAPAISSQVREHVRDRLEREGSQALHRVLASMDPDAAVRISPNDPQRIGRAIEYFIQTGEQISVRQRAHRFREQRYGVRAYALSWPRNALWQRIHIRTRRMYAAGLVNETQALLRAGLPSDAPGLRIIGYRDAVQVVRGRLTEEEAVEATSIATRQFAKRQRNWFNHEPTVRWIDATLDVAKVRRMVLDPKAL
ncbi:MAG: tRNA (adenosine(37)-N6)-dimethylallyltransferase MiaA [Myxococcota bacterium]